MNEEWIDIHEAAAILGIQKQSVYYHVRNGHLASQKIPLGEVGNSFGYMISRASVIALREGWNPQAIPAYEFQPTETECAYLAGLIDGEGTIVIRHKNHRLYSLLLAVYNTYEPLFDWLTEKFGSTKSHVYRSKRDRDRVQVWAWTASAFRAYHLLQVALPYLIIKKEQALLAIEFQEALSSRYRHRWNPISEEDLQWREEQRLRLQRLNKSRYVPTTPSNEPLKPDPILRIPPIAR